jgi:hypothetical protein
MLLMSFAVADAVPGFLLNKEAKLERRSNWFGMGSCKGAINAGVNSGRVRWVNDEAVSNEKNGAGQFFYRENGAGQCALCKNKYALRGPKCTFCYQRTVSDTGAEGYLQMCVKDKNKCTAENFENGLRNAHGSLGVSTVGDPVTVLGSPNSERQIVSDCQTTMWG